MKRRRVGIVGYRGYSGAELVHLLRRHPHVESWVLEHRQDAEQRPEPLGHQRPNHAAATPDGAAEASIELVFLATPPEVSMDLAPAFLDRGIRVVDLSGAFRLRTQENYRRWYKEDHTVVDLLDEAAYGLPEFCRERVKKARLVSNPGCYPTAANLAIRPLVQAGLVDRSAGIVCDAKSGVSGAGRKPSLKTSFCEVTENYSAYSILDHRHVPEVLLTTGLQEREFSFTAQLLPLDRGILETIYLRAQPGVTAERILNVYQEQFGGEPFVRLYKPGVVPDLRGVQRTNYCDIGFRFDAPTGRAVIVSVIDNLVKGAAGQAIQNMNLVLGYKETEALL
jgi:N-acetyl-gamma-glutamyl-phosphate reductase